MSSVQLTEKSLQLLKKTAKDFGCSQNEAAVVVVNVVAFREVIQFTHAASQILKDIVNKTGCSKRDAIYWVINHVTQNSPENVASNEKEYKFSHHWVEKEEQTPCTFVFNWVEYDSSKYEIAHRERTLPSQRGNRFVRERSNCQHFNPKAIVEWMWDHLGLLMFISIVIILFFAKCHE